MTTSTRTAKKLIGIISKKQLCMCSSLFCTFLCLFLHHNNVKLPSYMFYRGNVVYIAACLFFPCGSFLPRWLLEFLIFSLSFFVPTKFVSFDFYLLFWLVLCYPRPCHSNVTFDIDLRKDERTDGHVITKFSRVYRLPFSYPWCCS